MPNGNVHYFTLAVLSILLVAPAFASQAPHQASNEPDRWIVLLDTGALADTLLSQHGIATDAVSHDYRHALTGFAATITDDQARQLASAPGVKSVTRDRNISLPVNQPPMSFAAGRGLGIADPVADLTGATLVWQGAAPRLAPTHGEGIVVGIVGGRLNDQHPSFARTGGDGYSHTNPLGPGNYLGACASDPALCNEKLIGRWHYTSYAAVDFGTNAAAAQAAGNILIDQPLASLMVDPGPAMTVNLAGIAPHANIVEYAVCSGSSCQTSTILAGLDQARADNVDALIVTVGSSGDSPWTDPLALALQALRDAGTSVAVSLVSSASLPRNAPWTASVQRSSHAARPVVELAGFTGGLEPPQQPIIANGLNRNLTAEVVFAGDYGDPLCPSGSFPPGMFADSIVVCLRGSYALIDKVQAVLTGGGAAVIIAATATSSQTLLNFPYAALVSEADGNVLLDWLAQGSGHTLTMMGLLQQDSDYADRIPSNVARGLNGALEFLVPTLTAPSQAVFLPSQSGATVDIANGLASAPVAGAIALLKALHPDWTDAEALSALMTTAVTTLQDDGTGMQADTLLRGAGRIDVAAAAQAGLVMHESTSAFIAADPALGGDPAALNLPGLVQLDCRDACALTREVRATIAGSWTVQTTVTNATLTVSPSAFTLQAGERLAFSVDMNTAAMPPNEYQFGELRLVASGTIDETPPDIVLPVVLAAFSDADNDDVFDVADNCREIANPDQIDTDFDGYGNRCDPDLNDDGVVDFADLERLHAAFASYNRNADFNSDGVVDAVDLDIMKSFFFGAPGPGAL